MEEASHVIEVLTRVKNSLEQEDARELKNLSNQTVHAASIYQHTDYILVATIVYALSKIIERKDNLNIKNWQQFIREINSLLSQAIHSVQQNKHLKFIKFLSKLKRYIENYSQDLRPIIEDLLRKASINKASKIYEHGISLAKTTKLLGITPWELSEYIGEKENSQTRLNKTIDVKARATMAMEFFS
ncbi:hypothetical protein J4416_01600 [Candidatus Pacearchaeota archaeon]|nr:hypothetical protein [uncultured archaeon]AQS34494.1 hypothetical protein [uncultured archaeon]MBS3081617.1 hypothetical protein [Candidatus Pacearchaeota archaeon]